MSNNIFIRVVELTLLYKAHILNSKRPHHLFIQLIEFNKMWTSSTRSHTGIGVTKQLLLNSLYVDDCTLYTRK